MRRGWILRLVLTFALLLGPLHPWAGMALAHGSDVGEFPIELCAAQGPVAHPADDTTPAGAAPHPCLDCIIAKTALPVLPVPVVVLARQKARRLGRMPRHGSPALRRTRRPAARDPPDSARP